MNNGDEELTHLEQTIVDHAKKRYRRHVFRYGHLVGWLIVPIAAVLFVPAMHPYQQGFSLFILVVLLLSQSFTSTRIIGKLSAIVDRERNIEPAIPLTKAGVSLGSRPGLLFYVLMFPIALSWVGLTEMHFTWNLAGVSEVFAVESALGLYTAIIAMVGSYFVYFCTKNEPISSKLMGFGASVMVWFFMLIAIAALLAMIASPSHI
jgi:hypothetical protein